MSQEKRFPDDFGRSVRASSDYIGLGLQVSGGFAFFVFIGYWADSKIGTSPLLLLLGVVAGMVGIALVLKKVLMEANKK